MPLVLDPDRLPEEVLRELLASLRSELAETEEFVQCPPGPVRDPASLELAAELVRSARAVIDAPGASGRAEIASRANLAYAVLLATVDLVKSHADVPRVPRPRSRPPPTP